MRKLPVWKRIVFALLANLIVLSVLALLGEVACRLFLPQVHYEIVPESEMTMLRFSDSPYLGFELRPGVGDHSTAGFRGPERARQKPSNVWRLAVIGDSVPYGLGVEAREAFPSVLEAKLNEVGTGPAEVLNFGTPGYNTFQAYTLLETRVLPYDPDLVIITFSPDDVETSPVIINVGGDMCLFRNQFEGVGLLNNSVHWAAFRRLHLYRFLYKRAVLACTASQGGFDDASVQPDVAWKNVGCSAELCAERDARFLLVLSPFLLPHFRPTSDTDPRFLEAPEMLLEADVRQRYEQALDRIRELAEQSDLEYLDLGPLYEKHQGKLKLLPIDHEHLGPVGHELVAEALCERLLAMKDR